MTKEQCGRCGEFHYLQRHHKIPRTRGGSDDPENLIAICYDCHLELHYGTGAELPRGTGAELPRGTGIEFAWGVDFLDNPPPKTFEQIKRGLSMWGIGELCNQIPPEKIAEYQQARQEWMRFHYDQ